jgi:hypothetical protein
LKLLNVLLLSALSPLLPLVLLSRPYPLSRHIHLQAELAENVENLEVAPAAKRTRGGRRKGKA